MRDVKSLLNEINQVVDLKHAIKTKNMQDQQPYLAAYALYWTEKDKETKQETGTVGMMNEELAQTGQVS